MCGAEKLLQGIIDVKIVCLLERSGVEDIWFSS